MRIKKGKVKRAPRNGRSREEGRKSIIITFEHEMKDRGEDEDDDKEEMMGRSFRPKDCEGLTEEWPRFGPRMMMMKKGASLRAKKR